MLLSVLATLAALAPSLQTAKPCYLERQPVKLTGSDFAPGAPYDVTLDRAPVGRGTVGEDGTVAGTLSSGRLTSSGQSASPRQQRHVIAVHDGVSGAHAAFNVTPLGAGFTPSVGDPRTLMVRFSVIGIGVGAPAHTRVWLHYVDPRGHLLKTESLGLTSGPCGSLPSSAKLRLFPFAKVRAGRWTLQFDLRHNYFARAQPRITRFVAVK